MDGGLQVLGIARQVDQSHELRRLLNHLFQRVIRVVDKLKNSLIDFFVF